MPPSTPLRKFIGKRAHRALMQFGLLLVVAFGLLYVLGNTSLGGQSFSRMLWLAIGFYSLIRVSELLYKAVKLAFFVP